MPKAESQALVSVALQLKARQASQLKHALMPKAESQDSQLKAESQASKADQATKAEQTRKASY